MRHKTIGKEGLALCMLLMAAMSIMGFLFMFPSTPSENLGLCLPSPNIWPLNPWTSWGIQTGLLIFVAIGTIFLNKHYNFVKSPDPIAAAAFLIMSGSNPWLTHSLDASSLLLLANMLCISVLFGCYRQPNSTQEFFVVATIISLGSMVQYAFLLMIPVYIVVGVLLQTMHFKEVMAFCMGLAAPFWVGIGLGLLPLDSFTLPEFSIFFARPVGKDLFVLLINIGLTMLFSLIIGLNALVKLYAGNSRILILNNIIAVLGLASCIGIIVDFNNMTAYLGTFYFAAAFQIANLFTLWHIPRSKVVLSIIIIAYTSLFGATFLI